MEALVSKMQTSMNLEKNEEKYNQHIFAKDGPRIVRYSLGDTVSTGKGMDYNFHTITVDDTDRVLKFLRRFFFRDEPLNKAIKLIPDGEDSTCVELEEYSMLSLLENLSIMAVSSSGAIIGVILNGSMEPPKEDEPDYITNCANPKFKKILKLLNHVDKAASLSKKYPEHKIMELRIISVDGSWRGRGIAKSLVEKTEVLAKDLGYNMLRCDCSSSYSGKLCQRLGFELIYDLPYADYLDTSGKPVFTPAQPHTAIATYIKKL